MEYGLNIVNQNAVIDKAKTKADGIYTFRGVMYRVRNKKVTHFACCRSGDICQGFGHFNVVVGKVETGIGWADRARKMLKTAQ
ncbi:MAG TPA: hypothetical protein VFM18_17800 [Methanosarcina sp.]|nr:hypothetical protein [Methanosarcina sp.]